MHTLPSHCFSKPVTRRAQLIADVASLVCGSVCRNRESVAPISRYSLIILPLLLGLSQSLEAADLSMIVENITEIEGTLYWSIYDSQDSYDSEEQPLLAGRSRVIGESLQITLHDLPQGQYAVKLFHDANDNGEMDSNLLGLPQEGYGFSNNGGSFGPASFSDAMVELKENIQISIRLR